MQYEMLDINLLTLHYVQPMTVNRLRPLLEVDPTLETISHIPPTDLAQLLKMNVDKAQRIQENYNQVSKTELVTYYENQQIIPVFFYLKEYPKRLLEIFDPPAILYCRGKIEHLTIPNKIAIVGSRQATEYSKKSIDILLDEILKQDYAVVSGLARGADTLAHEATMRLKGNTIAVLGHGFHHIYPKENRELAATMMKSQLVITEYPPYMKPQKWHFPMRNRIISGISEGVIVTEANEKSGTMSTVDYALDHGRAIFAVPGDISSLLSVGPHKMIAEGAKIVWNGKHIIEELEK